MRRVIGDLYILYRKGETMNVLIITSWYLPFKDMENGKIHFVHEKAIGLSKYCHIALWYPYDMDLQCDHQKKIEKKIQTYRSQRNITKGGLRRIKNYFLILKDFIRIKREFPPDMIQAEVPIDAGRVAVTLGKIFHIPVVVTEHRSIEGTGLDQDPNKRVKRSLYYVYHNSNANICVSKYCKRYLERFFQKEIFKVIYNGTVDPALLKLDKQVYAQKGYINCGIVAGFYSKTIKGYQFLLPAIKELKKMGYPIRLHICGDGEYYGYFVNLSKELNIDDSCIFYGWCDKQKIYSIISQMDFNISASIFESAGISVQEAMLMGKPLVVTESGGADSLMTKDTGIIVKNNSISALIHGIEEMVRRLPEFDATVIKEYAYDNFEMDRVSRRYIQEYRSILAKRN